MAYIISDSNEDSFPKLGSVYRKGSGTSYVKQWCKNVASNTVNSANCVEIATEVSGFKNSAQGVWGRSNVLSSLGFGVQISGNGRTTQNANSKNVPSCKSDYSSEENCKIKHEGNVPTPEVVLPQLNYGEEKAAMDKVSNGKFGTPEDGLSQLNSGEEGGEAKDKVSNCKFGSFGIDEISDESYDDEVLFVSSDEDEIFDDDSDLDTSKKSHEICKKGKWFEQFFDCMDDLTVEELNSSVRQWHCPACKGGPGAIDWYKGLEPLMHHAITTTRRRVRLHRVFVEILGEETRRRGVTLTPYGATFGRWQGLNEKVKDFDIVWPPVVIIMNTRDEMQENGKWVGMGNQELLHHFSLYAAMKARHSYGPQGHRGMSALVFEKSAAGYLEAARLHKHFQDQGRDREAWNRTKYPFFSGGKRQLCGYMASKEDMEIFNQHSHGKSELKFEMRSYQEMVGRKIKQINDDSQEFVKVKDAFIKEKKLSQVLADSVSRLGQELRTSVETNSVLRERTKFLLESTKEELNCQEQFFLDQIRKIRQAIDAKEDDFEKVVQAKREEVEQTNANLLNCTHRMEDIASLMNIQENKELEEFEAERKKLIELHEKKKTSALQKYWEESVRMEKELEDELTQLMEKYKKGSSSTSSTE